ncbi:uncharacterized protein [Haliotis asinina]|uniref:uncharacterized protein n=1 Tax=Haliotis asinina TaxID=109174 RepID=UPI0035325254
MTAFEKQALSTSTIKPTCWYRKVDDTFVILRQDQDPATLLQHLNQQHPRVQFTFETETNGQLPFLDVLVTRSPDNKIETSVYRKPTHSDQYIHFDSNHPLKTKTGIISTLTRRAINLSSNNPSAEIEHLSHVFTKFNHYPPKLVDKIIRSTLHPTRKEPTNKPEPAPIRIALPFIGKTSYHISRVLKQQAGIETYFTSSTTLKTMLKANGRNTSKQQQPPKGVVYKINCDCGEAYVGETSRPINIRIKEHLSSTTKSDRKSAISDHIIKCPNHSIIWDSVEILSTRTSPKENWQKQFKSGDTSPQSTEIRDISSQLHTMNS